MNMQQAQAWLAQLEAAIAAGKITRGEANKQVYAEMEEGDHGMEVEDLFYEFTRK